MVEDGFELIGEREILYEIHLGLLMAVLPLPAVIAFGLLVSVAAQSATQAVTLALGATLAMDIFKALLGEAAWYLYATFHPSLLDQSYLREVSRLVRGFSDVLVEDRFFAFQPVDTGAFGAAVRVGRAGGGATAQFVGAVCNKAKKAFVPVLKSVVANFHRPVLGAT